MVIWGVMAWWYTDGWRQCLLGVKNKAEGALDYFSIDLLARTLFSPYRQIAAGQVRGSLEAQMRAFFDRLISRFIGMAVRLVMIVVGSVAVFLTAVVGGVVAILWGVLPFLPLIGLMLFLSGWMPWSN